MLYVLCASFLLAYNFISVAGQCGQGEFWIGGSDTIVEGEWVWQNSKAELNPSSYSNWYPGNPNGGGAENCMAIAGDGTWRDESCHGSSLYYICEMNPSKK